MIFPKDGLWIEKNKRNFLKIIEMTYFKKNKTAPKKGNQKINQEHSGGIPTNKEKAEGLLKKIKSAQHKHKTKLVQVDSKTWKEVRVIE